MLKYLRYSLIIGVILQMSAFSLEAQENTSLPGDFCISDEVYQLYKMINEYREQNDQPSLELSASLSYLALLHSKDLYLNHPYGDECTMNSWSDKGRWTSCCYSRDDAFSSCMTSKAKELTPYEGDAYELVYYQNTRAFPETVMAFWSSYQATADFLLNNERWMLFEWRSVGIGFFEGYASLWMGEEKDILPMPGHCDKVVMSLAVSDSVNSKNQAIDDAGLHYHVVIGSFDNISSAKKALSKLSDQQKSSAKILEGNAKIRLVLKSFPDMAQAREYRQQAQLAFPNAWVMEY